MINFPETIWGFKSDANLITASIPGYSPPCIPPVIDTILQSFNPFINVHGAYISINYFKVSLSFSPFLTSRLPTLNVTLLSFYFDLFY